MNQSNNKLELLKSPQLIARYSVNSLTGLVAKILRHFFYRARESFGQHKRDIVVHRVEDTCNALHDTRDQFENALEHFKSIVQYEGGSLEARYKLLKRQFDISQSKAVSVSEKIRAIEEVSNALFVEWEAELEQYTNRTLKTQSRQQLKITRIRYGRLIKAMHKAESKIQPVLAAFKDQVLFLKHNLNAQAIAALQHELIEIGFDIALLIQAMEKSIFEANSFVSTLSEQKALPESK